MPSLRQRVQTYFRQLSFIAEPRDGQSRLAASLSPRNQEDGCFMTRYLEGRLDSSFIPGPEIVHGKDPMDLPDLSLEKYEIGTERISGTCTGPDEGLTGVKRSRLHLSAGPDIDFIDTNQDQDPEIRHSISISSLKNKSKFGAIHKSDPNANKSVNTKRTYSRKNSMDQHPNTINVIVSMVSTKQISEKDKDNTIPTTTIHFKHSDNLNKNTDTDDIVRLENTNINLVNTENVHKEEFQKEELEPIAGVSNWKQENDYAYGLSVSLYEKNPITNEYAGNPIADCFGLVTRGNCAALALADGVNWGDGAKLAARSAVQGSLEYLNTAVFGIGPGGMATSTREVFISLLRSFWEAHACILEVGGALTTLTVAVVLPVAVAGQHGGKHVVCACNVGDSLGYIYSKSHGVREFTQGSHDITSMRDMRDALGALGPVDGKDPELGNLTLSLTIIDDGDIVFLTSDGTSDNFDPVVGKFAEPLTAENQIVNQPKNIEPHLAPKRQNKSASAIYSTTKPNKDLMKSGSSSKIGLASKSSPSTSGQQPIRPPRTKKTLTSTMSIPNETPVQNRPKYMRAHTFIEPRVTRSPIIKFPKSSTGLPLVTGMQRHALTLLRFEDLLCYGINGTLRPCSSAKKLCHLLVDFAKMITSAKRKILEQRELYYKVITRPDGTKREIELNRIQQRAARKKVVESSMFNHLPGKLDHASVVAFMVCSKQYNTPSNCSGVTISKDRPLSLGNQTGKHIRFDETNF